VLAAMVADDRLWAQLMGRNMDEFGQELFAATPDTHVLPAGDPAVSFDYMNDPDLRTTAANLFDMGAAVEAPSVPVALSARTQQPAEVLPSTNSQPSANIQAFANVQTPAIIQAPTTPQYLTAMQPPLNVPDIANVQDPPNIRASRTPQRLTAMQPPTNVPDFANVQTPVNIQAPTTRQRSTSIQPPAEVQPSAYEQPAVDPNPPTSVQDYIDIHGPANASYLASLVGSLDDLEDQVNQGLQLFSQGFAVFSQSKILAEIAKGLLKQLTQMNAHPMPNQTTSVDPSRVYRPSTKAATSIGPSRGNNQPTKNTASIDPSRINKPAAKDTASIDLSRDPRPGAKALLAARNGSANARPRDHIDSGNTHRGDIVPSSGRKTLIKTTEPRSTSKNPTQSRDDLRSHGSDLTYQSSNALSAPRTSNSHTAANTRRPKCSSQPFSLGYDDTSLNLGRSAGASRDRSSANVEVATTRRLPQDSSQARTARQSDPPSSGRPSSSSQRRGSKTDHVSASSRPRTGNSTSRLSIDENESYGATSSYQNTNPRVTRLASTGDTAPRTRRPLSANQAPAVDDSAQVVTTAYSSSSNGPTNTVAATIPVYDAPQLRLLDRTTLPKGNVNGIAYNCELRCGYPDSATDKLIQCESAYHGRQPTLKQPDMTRGERGWYHGPCGNVAPDEEPNGWICPSCVRRGTTSTDDNDNDDRGDESDNGAGPGDDSEDDFHPGKHTPSDSSDDEAGDDDNGDDDDYDNHQKGRNHGKKRRYILDSDGDGEEEDDTQNNQYGILPSIEDDQHEHGNGDNGGDGNNGNATQKPVVWKTNAGDPWLDEEKQKVMDHMKDIVAKGKIHGEARFVEISRRLKLEGYDREWTSVKNIWNRGLREKSGFDERRNKKAPMTTSKQDAETKRKNKEKKEQQRRSKDSESASSRHVSPKREREAEEEEEEEEEGEVVPAKRRRASPHPLDYFPGLK
jgi:hypothetical protein